MLIAVPLSLDGLRPTSYGGWPALGFAVALFLVAGPRLRWQVALAETVVVTPALMFGYEVDIWRALLGSLVVTVPSLLCQHLLFRSRPALRLADEVDSIRYHGATALTALLCAGLAALALLDIQFSMQDFGLSVLMSFLAALTAQLAVLPMLAGHSRRRAPAHLAELIAQRLLLLTALVVVFVPESSISLAFVMFPVLGWGAHRASRREAHVQLFIVCLVSYAFTFRGHGPFGTPSGMVPDDLTPTLLYLFMAACCYLTVPMTVNVERLSRMTSQATRSATTIQRLLDSASGTLFIATDAIGRITHYNAGAVQALGYTAEEVIGKSPEIFHTPEETARQAREMGVPDAYLEVVLAMVRTGARRDWEFVRKDGSRRMTSLTLSEVTDPEGGVIGYIGAGEDITERVRAQEALTQALEREHASVQRLVEVDNVKQDLVSNVSHELRTPITSISGYTEVLVDGSLGLLNQEQVDAVHRIERNTSRLGLLVEDLLTLSRAESGPLDLEHGELDLRRVVRDALDLLEDLVRTRSLDVRLEVDDEPVTVLGDEHALERVVMNLATNAIKFTPDDGAITVTVRRAGEQAELLVKDTGIGIPEADQEQLFTRFFRAAAANEQAIQGSGLGLSIVHALVVQHDGTVGVESAPGEGTTVTVTLPLAPQG